MERRNLLYGIILALLCVAITVVVVLILRKRAMLPSGTTIQTTSVTAPAGTVLLKDTPKAQPWKQGDPLPPPPENELAPQ